MVKVGAKGQGIRKCSIRSMSLGEDLWGCSRKLEAEKDEEDLEEEDGDDYVSVPELDKWVKARRRPHPCVHCHRDA